MSTLSIFQWIGIAAFCEILCRIVSGAFKSAKVIKDAPDIEESPVENEKVDDKIDFEITPKKKRGSNKRKGLGFANLAEELEFMYGGKNQPEDPLVKEGLRREDTIVSAGNVKVSSYYDERGKMVFQRETILPRTTDNNTKNRPKGVNDPSFSIKPQDASSSKGLNKTEEDYEKLYFMSKELGHSQKSFVDENIKKTFKDIYDMVLPSNF